MSQVRLPQEESPTSGEGERRSGDRIARRSLLDRALEKVQRLLGSPRSRFDRTRRLVAPLVLALVPLYWIVDATHRARLTTIGRD